VEYGIAYATNTLLGANSSSLKSALSAWREKLRFIHVSADSAKIKHPNIAKLMDYLLKIFAQTEILPDGLKSFLSELQTNGSHLAAYLDNEKSIFAVVYEPYLDGFSADDIGEIISKLPLGMFAMTSSECNVKVKEKAEEYRKGQLKVKLLTLWNDKTGTKNPREWSTRYKCPILVMVVGDNYDQAKKAFDTLNQSNPPEFAIKDALSFLETATFFDDMRSEEKRDEAFVKHIIGNYAKMLTIQKVKDRLDRFTVDAYDWFLHPQVKAEIIKLAEAEYYAGGSDRALAILGSMTVEAREDYIKRLINENVAVGLEIIARGGN